MRKLILQNLPCLWLFHSFSVSFVSHSMNPSIQNCDQDLVFFRYCTYDWLWSDLSNRKWKCEQGRRPPMFSLSWGCVKLQHLTHFVEIKEMGWNMLNESLLDEFCNIQTVHAAHFYFLCLTSRHWLVLEVLSGSSFKKVANLFEPTLNLVWR